MAAPEPNRRLNESGETFAGLRYLIEPPDALCDHAALIRQIDAMAAEIDDPDALRAEVVARISSILKDGRERIAQALLAQRGVMVKWIQRCPDQMRGNGVLDVGGIDSNKTSFGINVEIGASDAHYAGERVDVSQVRNIGDL